MKLKVWRIFAVGMVALVLISMVSMGYGNSPKQDSQNPWVTVIFQFGNQQVMSANVELPTDNHTAIKATELACEDLGLYLNYSWGTYGAYVSQIGWEKNDWSVSGYYWHLMVWQNDSDEWKPSSVGASSLNLSNGNIISWIYTVDNPNWMPYENPTAYPGHYSVWETPRGNANNTAVATLKDVGSDIIWKFKGQSQWGFSSTPVVGDGMIFIADDSNLYALNMNGDLMWNNSKGAAGYYGIASPTLFGNYVIIGTSDQYLRAFYTNNGTIAWETYIGEDITSAPVVDIVNKVPMVFVATFNFNSYGKLYALYLENGIIAWSLPLMGSNYFGVPAVYEGKIIVPIAGIEDSNYEWNPPYGIQCINENGSYDWNYTTNESVRSSPAVENGRIYFTTTGDSGELVSLSISGNEIWSYNIGASTSSPSGYKDTIYVGNNSGYLMAIEDLGSSGSLLWKEKLNGKVQAGITCASGKVIALTNTNDGTLYVFYSNGTKIFNLTFEPENYILSSPVIADSYILVASNNGYIYAVGDNSTLLEIGFIAQETAYVGEPVKIMVDASEQYQAFLYYKNISGNTYHVVWMNYTNGKYVGYIPPQPDVGDVRYYITLVDANGTSRTSGIKTAHVNQAVPELSYIGMILISAIFAVIIMRNRARH